MEKREQEFASEKPEGKGVVGRQPSLIGSVVNPVAYSSTTIVANGILISSKFAKKNLHIDSRKPTDTENLTGCDGSW